MNTGATTANAKRTVGMIRTLTWWLDRTDPTQRRTAAWTLRQQRARYAEELREALRRRLRDVSQ